MGNSQINFKDVSLSKAAALATHILDNGGHFVQKWTCIACGERVEMAGTDKLFTEGFHAEHENGEPCGITTDLRKHGCGIMALYLSPELWERLSEQLRIENAKLDRKMYDAEAS